ARPRGAQPACDVARLARRLSVRGSLPGRGRRLPRAAAATRADAGRVARRVSPLGRASDRTNAERDRGPDVSRPFTPDLVTRMRFVRRARWLRDGRVLYSVTGIGDDLREADGLWLRDLAADEPVEVAAELGDLRLHAPSPDGTRVAAVAAIGAVKQ